MIADLRPVIGSRGRWYPEWENGMPAFGLRLEWVRVECGCIVLHIEIVQPIEIVQHETGPKTSRFPIAQVAIDPRGVAVEPIPGRKQPTIMSEVVNADLEPIGC